MTILGKDDIAKSLFDFDGVRASGADDLIYWCDQSAPPEKCHCWCITKTHYISRDVVEFAKCHRDHSRFIFFTNVYDPLTSLMRAVITDDQGVVHYFDNDRLAARFLMEHTSESLKMDHFVFA